MILEYESHKKKLKSMIILTVVVPVCNAAFVIVPGSTKPYPSMGPQLLEYISTLLILWDNACASCESVIPEAPSILTPMETEIKKRYTINFAMPIP